MATGNPKPGTPPLPQNTVQFEQFQPQTTDSRDLRQIGSKGNTISMSTIDRALDQKVAAENMARNQQSPDVAEFKLDGGPPSKSPPLPAYLQDFGNMGKGQQKQGPPWQGSPEAYESDDDDQG